MYCLHKLGTILVECFHLPASCNELCDVCNALINYNCISQMSYLFSCFSYFKECILRIDDINYLQIECFFCYPTNSVEISHSIMLSVSNIFVHFLC